MNGAGFSDHASRQMDEEDDARQRLASVQAIMRSDMPATEKVLAIGLITQAADYCEETTKSEMVSVPLSLLESILDSEDEESEVAQAISMIMTP